MCISIHALVKRATGLVQSIKSDFTISIHALVKRATQFSINGTVIIGNFNPRPRKEGDSPIRADSLCNLRISIHALVKRATANLYNDYLYFEAKYHISDIFPL